MDCPGPRVGSGAPPPPFHRKNAATAATITITPINTGALRFLLSTSRFPPKNCPGRTVGSFPDRTVDALFAVAREEEDRRRPISGIRGDGSAGRLRSVVRELFVYFSILR